jgi:hypothetical protein
LLVGIEIASLIYKSFNQNGVAPPSNSIGAIWSQVAESRLAKRRPLRA